MAALVAVVVLAAPPARAEVRRVAFPVHGMICPLCTRGVEEAIRQLPGVGSVTADLASGRVVVEAAQPQSLDIQKVRERAARAGFPVVGEADVEARGRFEVGAEGRITFRPAGTQYTWQVVESNGLLAMFRAYPALKGDFVVEFRLHDRTPSTKPTISVTHGQPAPMPPPARTAARP